MPAVPPESTKSPRAEVPVVDLVSLFPKNDRGPGNVRLLWSLEGNNPTQTTIRPSPTRPVGVWGWPCKRRDCARKPRDR